MAKISSILFFSAVVGAIFCGTPIENNYVSQMEEGTLLQYWKNDMDYVMSFFKTPPFPSYERVDSELVRCKIHEIRFQKTTLNTEDVKMVIDPARLHINFTQKMAFEFEGQLLWEYNLLYLPISGSATFKGRATDVLYTLNLTDPYQGKLLVPSLNCTWEMTSFTVDSPLGSLLGIPALIEKTFKEAMAGPVMDLLDTDMKEDIPLRYEEYYSPKPDVVSFQPVGEVEVMRRYKRIYIDVHLMTVVYQEIVEHAADLAVESKKPQKIEIVPNEVKNDGYLGSGMLRRYIREFTVFEQIAKKFIPQIKDIKITDADLPKDQKMRLDSAAMETLLPSFKSKFGEKTNITLYISGTNSYGNPEMAPLEPQLVKLANIGLKFSFYAKDSTGADICFLKAELRFAFDLKPFTVWQDKALMVNFDHGETHSELLNATSDVFKDIIREAVQRYAEIGTREYLSKKYPKRIMGDGLKLRDELGTMKNTGAVVDVAGRTLNTWIYITKDLY